MVTQRRRAIGAELVDGGVHFRVWAPSRRAVHVVVDDRELALDPEDDGYFSALVADACAGTRYRFRLDDESESYPDPASRFQPDGPHGASQVIDPRAYTWRDDAWRGVTRRGLVIYELHVGTFTEAGTWRAAESQFESLRDIGINLIEVMPIAEFPGEFGWGYDGVDLFAPSHLYGTPDDFRHFVEAAHLAGIGVILDVVYNHFGPDGNYLTKFTPHYFTSSHVTEWGEAINFDGEQSRGVRELFAENATYWIDEFHLDGLRFDATQAIHDSSDDPILALLARRARAAAGERTIFLVAENEPEDVALIERCGIDALWNDDWHHAAMVAATGRAEAYYSDYNGGAQEFVSMARYGFLFQGQRYEWQKNRRGTPSLHLLAENLVCYLQNHDQVANSADGERLHKLTTPGRFRALTALLLLQPQTPMLFQGQERGASSPFLYFADHNRDLATAVANGRKEFLLQFRSVATVETAVPHARETFEGSKLDATRDERIVRLHRDLLRLRRDDPAFAAQRNDILHGAVLSDEAFLLRFIPSDDADAERLLLINLGRDLDPHRVPEPLLAPPRDRRWTLLWSSEAPEYGGSGTAALEDDYGRWRIGGHACFVLKPAQIDRRV
jgi:maltooligosyltrehalose trehalohydrolase